MKQGQMVIHAEKKFVLWLAAAAAMHILVLILALYLQLWDSGRHKKPSKIVSVTLVSELGTGGSAGFSEEPAGAAPQSASVPESAPAPPAPEKKEVKQTAVQEPTLPKPSKSKVISEVPAKPKPAETQEQINKALQRLKQAVDKKTASESQASSAGNLNNALAQLQKKVKADGSRGGTGTGTGRGRSSGGRGGDGGSGGGGPYKAVIASIIQKNWEFSQQMLKSSYGMEVYVRINILADGTIRQILFDKRAPSEYLNNSVKKALEKSSPLPALPKEEGAWVGFVFTPEGIEK
jgi:colicin import membrane protein